MATLINIIDEKINFNEHSIRIVGTYDRPLFVASDICKILGLSNVTDTLRSLPDKWKEICDLEKSKNIFKSVYETLNKFYLLLNKLYFLY